MSRISVDEAARLWNEASDDELRELAGRVQELAATAALVTLQFNNNRGSDAPVAAQRMRELLGPAI